MHIKKFEGRDLKEALGRIRQELGPEAVILETVQNPSSVNGIQVLAALPRETRPPAEGADLLASLSSRALGSGDSARRPLPARLETAGADRQRQKALSMAAGGYGAAPAAESILREAAPSPPPLETGETDRLRARVEHLTRLVRSDHFSQIPLPLRQVYFDLTDAEVDADLVFHILQKMGSVPLPGQFTAAPPDDVLRALRSLIQTGGAVTAEARRRVVALVGPTGVGKTTTAAKIAGDAAFHLGLEVALVSTDSYRVFGAQHLASYAALMGLPFDTVSSSAEMRWLLQARHPSADLILVDTSGRSPRDPRGIAEIHGLLGGCPDLEVHLVLAANARARDLALALESFSAMPIRHLIFTKVDEATSTGGLFTTALKARRPVSYLGTGQEVPDDLEPATLEALTRDLVGEATHVGSGR